MKINVLGKIFKQSKLNPPPKIINKDKILFVRKHRLGDIIMLEPILRYFSQTNSITLSTLPEYNQIQRLLNFECNFINYNDKFYNKYNKIFFLDTLSTNNFDINTKIDLFFASCQIDPALVENKIPILKNIYSKTRLKIAPDKKIICIGVQSYNINSPRSLPIDRFYNIFDTLNNFQFVIVGRNPIHCNIFDNVINWTGNSPNLEELFSIINLSNVCITVDTGLMHAACAFSKPTISIFGPTRPHYLAGFYKTIDIIDMNMECSPCWDKGCNDYCTKKFDDEYLIERILNATNN
jgi:ADP-heptose:LPS heptosyltransferase